MMDLFLRGFLAGCIACGLVGVFLIAWRLERRERGERFDWGDDPRTAGLASGATTPNIGPNGRQNGWRR